MQARDKVMETEDTLYPFIIPDLWRQSLLTATTIETGLLFPEIELDVTHIHLHNPYAPKVNLEKDLRLPEIDNFVYGPLDDIYLPEESVVSTEPEIFRKDEEEDDIWSQVAELPQLLEKKAFSWETFLGATTPIKTPYLSESGPSTFDAVIRAYSSQVAKPALSGPVIEANPFLDALQNVALGRSSLLFDWSERSKTFKPMMENFTSHGYSSIALLSFCDKIMTCGSAVNRLRKFSEKTYTSGDIPSRVALANAISTVLSAIEAYLSKQFINVRSLLQLQEVIEKPRQLLQEMMELVRVLRSAKSDEKLSSITFNRCLRIEHDATWLGAIMLQILSRITRPLLDRIDGWIGFSQVTFSRITEDSLGFIKLSDGASDDVSSAIHFVEETSLPEFISKEAAEQICEIGQGLRLLKRHHPNHVLVESYSDQRPISLEWKNQWSAIDATLERARQYEAQLVATVRNFSGKRFQSHEKPAKEYAETELSQPSFSGDYEAGLLKSLDKLDLLPLDSAGLPDELLGLVLVRLESPELEVDWTTSKLHLEPAVALLPMLSFNPFLNSQARLVRGACVRALFRSHNLREHLRVQKLFHLMGDGVFLCRISAALFDPTAATTERQLGVMRSGTGMGLKLSDRQSWPPASSELRLALMGILNDCYHASANPRMSQGSEDRKKDLPGGFSFAIRNLSEDEVERIMDPNSLYALDFLRLQYSPPSPIDMVVTPLSLEKYDAIFKFLLRIVRLLFVVSRLPLRGAAPAVLRFGMQARHFVNTCAQYFFDTAIGKTWNEFEGYLDDVEANLRREDEENPEMMKDVSGIEDLRKRHEACLDKMLFGLLLRHRQQKMVALLEEIYSTILGLEQLCRAQDVEEQEAVLLHDQFLKKTQLFLEVCRSLVGKKGYATETGKDSGIEILVTGLDFNGYYSSKP